ncbi:MAG: HAMP domain-containing histidine kinase [Oscillospiraceae bacterium]|jgi:signal transduction histidine kinase|nr:HAMP domain-containing histidine kinase [Oscillospiraceae bacterium]
MKSVFFRYFVYSAVTVLLCLAILGFVALRAAYAVTEGELMARAFSRVFMMTAFWVLLIAFVTAYLSSRYMARPFRDMAACARSFERGDFSARVGRWDERDDEIGELAAAFNGMAESLERVEELRRSFIGGVSHELKTPMTTISGYIEGILDGTVPPERREETLVMVREEVLRLSRLVSGMMELSRHETQQMKVRSAPFDISETAARVLLGMEQKINQKGISVDVLVPEEPVIAKGDPDGITQVLTNLLDNAVKFCNPGGSVALTVAAKGGRARVTVKNTGAGIQPEDLPRVFERFYKGDRSRSLDPSGLGLGLYIVKSILNAHGEDIDIRSDTAATEFSFSLPLQ